MEATLTVVVLVVFNSAITPPGGMMSEPSNSSTASPENIGVAVAPWAATSVPQAAACWMIKGLVSPVRGVVMLKPLACDPAWMSARRLRGASPVDIAELPVEVAHMNAPGATAELPATVIRHFALTRTRFTLDDKGFHTPTIGVVVAEVVTVFADSAVEVIPTENKFPRYVDS